MTKMVVDFGLLAKYSKDLDDDAQQFGIITENMKEIIDSLKRRGWRGYDADTFINNAITYLDDLRVVKEKLISASQGVHNRNKRYEGRVQDYFDSLKARREADEQQNS